MVVISPTSNLPITKDSFTNSKINEEFNKGLILEKPKDNSILNDNWLSAIPDWITRGGKSFEDSLISSLNKEGFKFTVKDLNWLLASGVLDIDIQKYLIKAYLDPSKHEDAVRGIKLTLDYVTEMKKDGKEFTGKQLAMLYESKKVICDDQYTPSTYFFKECKFSPEEIYERKEILAAYMKKQESNNRNHTDIFEDLSKANDYLPSNQIQYKKALDILIQYGSKNNLTGSNIKPLALGITGLVEKYPSLSVEQISEKLYTATDDGLNKSKVFHTNAPELIYNRTGILLSSRGDKGKSKMDNTLIKMPDLDFANEDFQISGHHIFRGFQEKTYLVYVAHNQSSEDASIKIENGGVSTTSESPFSNTHQDAKVYDTSDGNFTVGPGDKAASAVLDGKTDSRIRTDSQGNINIPANSTQIIAAIATNGYDGVTANIQGHINGSVKMTAAVITASDIHRYGSIENAVNHHLKQGNFLAEKHGGPVGRAHGIYEGSEYNINKNLFLTDQGASPDKEKNILAESIIASTKYYGEEQSGKVLKGNNGKEALLEGYSSDDGNIGNYNTLYKLNYNIHNLASDEKKHGIKVNFASLAKGGRSDQAAFRGNIVLELKDTEGRIIQRIKRQVSIGFNEEVTAFNDIQIGSNVNSAEIKMVNTADSTPPYKISVLKT
jgi:hypothetical protein